MIRRFYVHNYRCLENFELNLGDMRSVLLIGKNGSGKSAVGKALEVLQRIARGDNSVDDLVKPKDFPGGWLSSSMRFEISAELHSDTYCYSIAFTVDASGRRLEISEESLKSGGNEVYSRVEGDVQLNPLNPGGVLASLAAAGGKIAINRRLAALPVLQSRGQDDPLAIFRRWLAGFLVLRPNPSLMSGDSDGGTLEPSPELADFGEWFSGVLAGYPSAYTRFAEHAAQVMSDFEGVQNPEIGKEARRLVVKFSNEKGSLRLPFKDLSDGEKCFLICALVLAANEAYGPLVCFWHEPGNFISLDEVGHLVIALRKEFETNGGQFIATSHNPEAIRAFPKTRRSCFCVTVTWSRLLFEGQSNSPTTATWWVP